MSEQPKRNFWHIRSSTVLIMGFIAGIVLVANLWPRSVEGFEEHGWPFLSWTTDSRLNIPYEIGFFSIGDAVFITTPFLQDILICTLMTLVIGFACEMLIRRREANHQ